MMYNPGDVLLGDVLSGDILSGDVLSGDVLSGNALFGSNITSELPLNNFSLQCTNSTWRLWPPSGLQNSIST